MKSRILHALALSVALASCKTGSGSTSGRGSASTGVSIDPTSKVAEVDGKPITYAEVQTDKETGPKLRQAESKALTELYEVRKGLVDEMISRLQPTLYDGVSLARSVSSLICLLRRPRHSASVLARASGLWRVNPVARFSCTQNRRLRSIRRSHGNRRKR